MTEEAEHQAPTSVIRPQQIERLDVSFHYFEDHPEGYLACVCYFPVVLDAQGQGVYLQHLYGSQMLTWTQVPETIQAQLLRLKNLVKEEVTLLPDVEFGGKIMSPPAAQIVEIEVLNGQTVNVKFKTPTAVALALTTRNVASLGSVTQELIAEITSSFGGIAQDHFTSRLTGANASKAGEGKFALPLRVFFSYSHRDERLVQSLREHLSLLQRENLIESWTFRKISPGTEWAAHGTCQ